MNYLFKGLIAASLAMAVAGCIFSGPSNDESATVAARTSTDRPPLLETMGASTLNVSDRYCSPRNAERKIRAATDLIVLHTAEAPAESSLKKLSERGEVHYCVTEDGTVYSIVDRDREAFHAGQSMWNGKEDVDKFSIGIACVGYNDKGMGAVQLKATRDLVKELQRMYKIPDDCVVSHSHVAYGAPNKWHEKNHRGRTHCGMIFATPTVRAQLSLSKRPTVDPDVMEHRLVVGDDYLQSVLYGTNSLTSSPSKAP